MAHAACVRSRRERMVANHATTVAQVEGAFKSWMQQRSSRDITSEKRDISQLQLIEFWVLRFQNHIGSKAIFMEWTALVQRHFQMHLSTINHT